MTQAFNLALLANNLNSTGQLDATDGLVNAVPVANGGTGASTSAAARTNLSVPSTTGGGASGTWPISITGNAATATSASSVTSSVVTTALGYTPVQQGTGTNQGTNAVKIGWGTGSYSGYLAATVDVTDLGVLWSGQKPTSSLGGNGYQKLPSGMIMQWGSFTQTGSETAVGFPISFPTAVGTVQITIIGAGSVSAPGVAGVNTSGFTCFRDPVVGNTSIYWFAIGW